MSAMTRPISVAIETTCRAGGVALGDGDALLEVFAFDSARRAAAQLAGHLDALLRRHDLTPADVDEMYVSVGPGSYTGTRVGVTVARTMGQVLDGLHLVAVPAVLSVVENLKDREEMMHLAVVLDARAERIYAARFDRLPTQATDGSIWRMAGEPVLTTPGALLANAPRPLWVTGEGLGYHEVGGDGVHKVESDRWLPRVEHVWQVGRRLARAGKFVRPLDLLPLYTGKSQAERMWDEKGKS